VHGIPLVFSSVKDLVNSPEVDVVYVASSNNRHRDDTLAAAEAGKHVLLEKPMALDAGEAEEMIRVCTERNVKLMVAHMLRMSPLVRRMREIVASGILGTIRHARAEFIYDSRLSTRKWLFDRAVAGGGPVYDVGVHCVDTLRYILDDEVVDMGGLLQPLPTKARTEDTATLAMRFLRGAHGVVMCSYHAPRRRKPVEIIGDEGTISTNDFAASNTSVDLTIIQGTDDRPGKQSIERIHVPDLYALQIDHFSRCILGREPLLLTAENGLRNQILLDRALAIR
jgi:1,5-anhydro-D-fructose reductase (1,5-anhydro-D-mannitol-forming)